MDSLEEVVASIKAEDFSPRQIKSDKTWKDIYAISEHIYAFDDSKNLYAWGRNDNYSLGLGIEYKDSLSVLTPAPVTYKKIVNDSIKKVNINYDNLKAFSPVVGGFVFLTKQGELWAAGKNFYMNAWFPLPSPRRIGFKSNWTKFHDFKNGEQNVLIEKRLRRNLGGRF
jgi:alpha-tubulin suppressor-like RCC1 family protein